MVPSENKDGRLGRSKRHRMGPGGWNEAVVPIPTRLDIPGVRIVSLVAGGK